MLEITIFMYKKQIEIFWKDLKITKNFSRLKDVRKSPGKPVRCKFQPT